MRKRKISIKGNCDLILLLLRTISNRMCTKHKRKAKCHKNYTVMEFSQLPNMRYTEKREANLKKIKLRQA